MISPQILHISTGSIAPLTYSGRVVMSGIRKRPVHGPVAVGKLGLAGDEQADLSVHGGLGKAVYAYPVEHLPFWQNARVQAGLMAEGETIAPGFLGENLLVQGLLETEVFLGDTLRFAGSDCVLRVTAAREPCYKLNAVTGLPDAARTMVRQALCGFYLAVQTPGTLEAGMAITVEHGAREYSVADAIQGKWAKHRNG